MGLVNFSKFVLIFGWTKASFFSNFTLINLYHEHTEIQNTRNLFTFEFSCGLVESIF